jgi:hypothetical protein
MLALQIEHLSAHLLDLNAVVDLYQQNDSRYVDRSLAWLAAGEEICSRLRLVESAELAALRARLLAAGEMAMGPDGRPSRNLEQRQRRSVAAAGLESAQALLSRRCEQARENLYRFRQKVEEMLTAASLLNLLPAPPEDGKVDEAWLHSVWSALMRGNGSIRPAATWIATGLATADRLYLLHEVVANMLDTSTGLFAAAYEKLAPTPASSADQVVAAWIAQATALEIAEVGHSWADAAAIWAIRSGASTDASALRELLPPATNFLKTADGHDLTPRQAALLLRACNHAPISEVVAAVAAPEDKVRAALAKRPFAGLNALHAAIEWKMADVMALVNLITKPRVIEGVEMGYDVARALLWLVNHESEENLAANGGLTSRSIGPLFDQRPLPDLENLAAISYVGAAALRRLALYATTWQPSQVKS